MDYKACGDHTVKPENYFFYSKVSGGESYDIIILPNEAGGECAVRAKEFADVFQIGKETIRYYREQQWLHPTQGENGYFDYSVDDLGILFQVMNYSLSHEHSLRGVQDILNSREQDFSKIIEENEQSIEEIDCKIRDLTTLKRYLQSRRDYRKMILETMGVVQVQENACGLYYIPLSRFAQEKDEIRILRESISSYQSIVFPAEALTDPAQKTIHPEYALGVTDANYHETPYYRDCDLTRYDHISAGHNVLRWLVRLPTLQEIDKQVFDPIIAYAQTHHLHFAAPVTSIIMLAETMPKPSFYVMFRFVVEREEG